MQQVPARAARAAHAARLPAALAVAAGIALAACGGSSASKRSSAPPGSIALNPRTGTHFVVSEHHGGESAQPRLVAARWGRLVDLHDVDAQTGEPSQEPMFVDLLVDPHATSDGFDYLVDPSPVSGRVRLVVLHARGTPEFKVAFAALANGLQALADKGLHPSVLPPFSVWPRNAALALEFDDLLDDGGDPGDQGYPGTVTLQNVRVAVGNPPQQPFGLRILPDPNHGDLLDGRFHTTRVLLDPAVSKHEALASGLPVNVIGLPEAVTASQANVALRIPTQVAPSVGQLDLLRNLSGHALSLALSGPGDSGAPTADVVRALRSGSAKLGDAFHGFLPDDVRPRVVAVLPIDVTAVQPLGGASYLLDLTFQEPQCASAPQVGDLIELADTALEVSVAAGPPSGGTLAGLQARLLGPLPPSPGFGALRTAYAPSLGHQPECFVRLSPKPGQVPAALVQPSASATLTFSEPMDPASVRALETFALEPAAPAASPLGARVVGQVVPSQQLDAFTLQPSLPLHHAAGATEAYRVVLAGGVQGVTDLAGNPLAAPLPKATFTLDPAAPALATGGIALTFSGPDEDGDGFPELRGQGVFDLARGVLLPRPVTRFSALVDTSSLAAPTAQAWTPLFGFPEPLSPHGSRMMALWRYHDLGFDLLDEGTINIDVEGLAWQPETGISLDHFPLFEIALAHSRFLPDEALDPATGGVWWPNSGVSLTFDDNLLHPAQVVHPRTRGYHVHPLDALAAPSGTLLAPWPLNRGVAPSQFEYFTWRDTAVEAVGAPDGQGVDTLAMMNATGAGGLVYAVDQVPTIGLPLLMEFKSWPGSGASGQNRVMMGMANTVGIPYFRTWSGGFVGGDGQVNPVNPDSALIATGGLDPAGNPIPGRDIGVVYGQADFVVRVSRVHSAWLDTGSSSSFAPAVLDPLPHLQPTGTGIELAFRGAVALGSAPAWSNADNLDPYGNGSAFTVTWLDGDSGWKTSLAELEGARFVQVRVTFTSNAESGVAPELGALGFAYHH